MTFNLKCENCGCEFARQANQVRRARAKKSFCSVNCRKFYVRPLVERFWENVEKSDGCWLWTGHKNSWGYGNMNTTDANGIHTTRIAHRISYEIHIGEIPNGLMVLHHCDNPPCVRPDHLFLGTAADNLMDCVIKGRRHSKLKVEDVNAIRLMAGSGAPTREIKRKFGIAPSTVRKIVTRRTWDHI